MNFIQATPFFASPGDMLLSKISPLTMPTDAQQAAAFRDRLMSSSSIASQSTVS